MPAYRTRIALGMSATSSMVGTLVRINNPGYFTAHYSNPSAVGPFDPKQASAIGFLPVTPVFSHSGIANLDSIGADNAAKLAFVRKAKGVNRAFQSGVFLGELAEACRMIKNPAYALRRGIPDYLKALKVRRSGVLGTKNRAHRSKVLEKILQETWLEYSFGWTPLLKDIDQGAEALAKAVVRPSRPKLQYVSGVGKASYSSSRRFLTASQGPLQLWTTEITTLSQRTRYYGSIRVMNPSDAPFRHFGVNLAEFIPTAWELVPWSFFVDYFANIGDMLDCATFIRSDLSWLNKGEILETVVSYSPWTNPAVNPPTVVSGGQAEFALRSIARGVYSGSLVPNLEFRLPLSGKKIANIAALLPALKRLTPFF